MVSAWVSFSITPVQSFVQAARTVRDLKVGSRLLSYLTAKAYEAASTHAQNTGGDVLYPRLLAQGSQWWESLPNRFVVRFPTLNAAQAAAEAAEDAARRTWHQVAADVKQCLDRKWGTGWSPGWDEQIQTFWDIRVLVLDMDAWSQDAWGSLFALNPGGQFPGGGLRREWRILATALAAAKQVRQVPPFQGIGRYKCTMMGDLEQMGPGGPVGEQRNSWSQRVGPVCHGIRLDDADRLCAVALVKRFAPACHNDLQYLAERIPDTATIAVAPWRDQAKEAGLSDALHRFDAAALALVREIDGTSGDAPREADQALRSCYYLCEENLKYNKSTFGRLCREVSPRRRREMGIEDLQGDAWKQTRLAECLKDAVSQRNALLKQARDVKLGPPSHYLAVIALDGDHMGRHLGGDYLPWGEELTPDHFHHLSEALVCYGRRAEKILGEHYGEPIYTGGDDVLGLVPVSEAVPAALALHQEFPRDLSRGSASTASVGIAVFHYRHPLRDALRQAHAALDRAKEASRDAFGIVLLKRSGETVELTASREMLESMQQLAGYFQKGASDRWAGHIAQLLPGLAPEVTDEQVASMLIKRFVDHAKIFRDEETLAGSGGGAGGTRKSVIDTAIELWSRTWAYRKRCDADGTQAERGPGQFWCDALAAYVQAIGVAAFLVRGGE